MQIQQKQLLRFITAGSVDDGKSTLIGRLLYDSKSIFEDQLNHIEQKSENKGLDHVDLSLLTDGLKDEREQGITIDVAYRYFATPKRKFIIADTPGHIQYTRNMVTGASTAHVALILIDIKKGVIEQTKRHSFIASLLEISHLIVCVNKMDLVDYCEDEFNNVVEQYKEFSAKMPDKNIQYIPVSALKGDNVVERSDAMSWYQGDTLLSTLENVNIIDDHNEDELRFPVQTVIRHNSAEYHNFRGYAGSVASGVINVGDTVVALPSNIQSKIASITLYDQQLSTAFPPMSVTISLEDEIDLSRGDMIVKVDNQPKISQEFEVMICWLNDKPLLPKAKYYIKHTSNEVKSMVKEVLYKIDINSLQKNEQQKDLQMNDIALVRLKTMQPLFIDDYKTNTITGSLIMVDEMTNETVAAGMIMG